MGLWAPLRHHLGTAEPCGGQSEPCLGLRSPAADREEAQGPTCHQPGAGLRVS